MGSAILGTDGSELRPGYPTRTPRIMIRTRPNCEVVKHALPRLVGRSNAIDSCWGRRVLLLSACYLGSTVGPVARGRQARLVHSDSVLLLAGTRLISHRYAGHEQ